MVPLLNNGIMAPLSKNGMLHHGTSIKYWMAPRYHRISGTTTWLLQCYLAPLVCLGDRDVGSFGGPLASLGCWRLLWFGETLQAVALVPRSLASVPVWKSRPRLTGDEAPPTQPSFISSSWPDRSSLPPCSATLLFVSPRPVEQNQCDNIMCEYSTIREIIHIHFRMFVRQLVLPVKWTICWFTQPVKWTI